MVERTESPSPLHQVILYGLAFIGVLKLLTILGADPSSWVNTIGRMIS